MNAAGEFTIGPIRTPQELDLAWRFLLRIFPSLQTRWPGPRFFCERLASQSPMMLAARDFALLETHWQGVPQLWVQRPGVDRTLTNRVSGWDGVHAQWVMDKDVNPPQA
jgi:hypothetical protein